MAADFDVNVGPGIEGIAQILAGLLKSGSTRPQTGQLRNRSDHSSPDCSKCAARIAA